MIRKINFFILGILSMLFNSCGNTNKSVIGTYKEQEVQLFSKERRTFVSNIITYSVQLGKHPRISLDHNIISDDGVPYDTSIFGETKQVRFSAYDSLQYKDAEANVNVKDTIGPIPQNVMLYIDPSTMNQASFEAYADFFENKWESLRDSINKDWTYLEYNIIGMVYGNKEEFTHTFSGKYFDKDWELYVKPNGKVEFWRSDYSSSQGIGLSNKVIMPGRKLKFKDGATMTYDQLLSFKDKHNKTIADYFNIEKID